MFSHLAEFGYKRSALQAVVFYIVYLISTILIAGVTAMILAGLSGRNDFGFGQNIGMIVAIIIVVAISYLILQSKKLTNNYIYLMLIVAAGFLSFIGGALLGLLIPAYFTTLNSASPKKKGRK